MAKAPKTEFLQIRLTPEDRERVTRIAESEHLDPSTWARKIILEALAMWESQETEQKKKELN